MLAVAAMMGASQSVTGNSSSKPIELKISRDLSNDLRMALRFSRRPKGRVAQNQKQRRKDRRRAWAAGDRKAFNK